MSRVQDQLEKIKKAYHKKTRVNFKIVTPKENGFLVKTEGLYAFISYSHFCWTYPVQEYWQVVAPLLVGKVYTGIIHHFSEDPVSIIINGKEQLFELPPLQASSVYRAIILQKSNYGFFVDLGYHFHWQHGSIFGLIHKSTLQYASEYDLLTPGQEITTRFFGYNEKGKIMLGDNEGQTRDQWTEEERKELAAMIGSRHLLTVRHDDEDKPVLDFLDKYQASLPIKKEFYGAHRIQVREYVERLKDGDEVLCEVANVGKRRKRLVVKLVDWEDLLKD
jgi:ribosomal protein S1